MCKNTVEEFVKHLLRSLCQKFSQKSGEETPILDSFCNELIELSRHFQDYILSDIFKMPSSLLTLEELFLNFLDSVCSEICGLEEVVEKKFFILCTFLTIITTLSFTLPCYRLVNNIKMILIFKLKTRFSLNVDVQNKLEELEGQCLLLTQDRLWIRSQLRQLRAFIQKAMGTICSGLEKQPDVASFLKTANESKLSNSAGSSRYDPCPFCQSNCKSFLEKLLNC